MDRAHPGEDAPTAPRHTVRAVPPDEVDEDERDRKG
jgi:hypothetical protein